MAGSVADLAAYRQRVQSGRLASRPEMGEHVELPVRVEGWHDFQNVRHVRAVLAALENAANFDHPAMLAEVMARDDRVSASLRTRQLGLFGSPRNIHPADDSLQAQEVADRLEELWEEMFPSAQLEQVQWWGLMGPMGLGELIWTREGGEYKVRLRQWHPQYLYWRWDTRHFHLSTSDAGTIELPPSDGQWLIYSPSGYYRGWMASLMRSLAVPWLARQWALRDWSRSSEVDGLGIKKASVPSEASLEDKTSFFSSLQSLGSESLVILPKQQDGKGFDFDYVTTNGPARGESFERLVNKTETAIAIAVLGQSQTTDIQKGAGSKASASVHNEIRLDYRRADARSLAAAIRDQVLRPWAKWNFGDEALAPIVEWDVEPEDDQKAKADALLALGQGLTAMQQAGAPVDVRAVLEDAAVPMVDEDETDAGGAPTNDDPAPPKQAKLRQAEGEVAVVAVFNRAGEMLWGRRRDNGRWTTPGGHVEPGENIEEAARRELAEEAGITDGTLAPVASGRGGDAGELDIYGFTLVTGQTPTTANDPDEEVDAWVWVDVSRGLPADVLANLHVPEERNILLLILGSRPRAIAMSARDEAEHVRGQRYADGIAAAAEKRAASVLRPDVERVLEAIEKAESFEALRAELPKLLETMDPTELAGLTKDASVLALLAGRHAVQREV